MTKFILSLFLLIIPGLHLKAQEFTSLVNLEAGVSSTYSWWEAEKPAPGTYGLNNFSQASPFVSVEYRMKISRDLTAGVGVSACPVSWKKFTYYYDAQNIQRRRISTHSYGEWQFPLVIAYTFGNGLFAKKHVSHWQLETGIIPSLRNASLDLNNASLNINDSSTTERFDNGYVHNYKVPIAIAYAVYLPNKKVLKIKATVGFGTRLQMREYVDREENYIIRTNGSFVRISLNYGFPIVKKDK